MKITVFIFCLLVSLKAFCDPAMDDLKNAIQSYQQGQYDQAVQSCQDALQKDPQNWQAYQVLGQSYYKLFKFRKAVLAFDLSLKIHPDNPSLQKFADYVRKSLPPAPAGAPEALFTPPSPPLISLRSFIARANMNLGDLSENAATLEKSAALAQKSDTSTYFYANFPGNAGVAVVEPGYWLDQNWQVGVPLSFYNIGEETTSQHSNSLGTNNATFSPTAFCAGLSARYMVKFSCFQFDASAGPLLALMGLNYSGTNSTTTASGNFSSTALEVQATANLSLELFHCLTFGPTVGYQTASASGFHGSISGAGIPAIKGTWEMVPGPSGTALTILPDGTPAPTGSRPFKMDISGLNYGGQMSFFF